MRISKVLSPGERVVVSMRTHWKVLILPGLVLIATCAVAGFLAGIVPSGSAHKPLVIAILLGAAAIVVTWALRPFLLWLSATYTVTDRRLISRSGIVVQKGRDVPLQRITDVSYERGVLDRVFGCGTLVVADASERGHTVLPDVPRVERLQVTINDLLFSAYDGSDDDGAPSGLRPPPA
jgi:membrane protein YdbS with pleckstrin-like domain